MSSRPVTLVAADGSVVGNVLLPSSFPLYPKLVKVGDRSFVSDGSVVYGGGSPGHFEVYREPNNVVVLKPSDVVPPDADPTVVG